MPSAPNTWCMCFELAGWRSCGLRMSGCTSDAMPELPYGSLPGPGTPVWQLKGWVLDIRCSRCRRHTILHLGDLVDQYSREASVMEVVGRLQCDGFRGEAKCRAKPSRVTLIEVSYHGKSWRKLREVVVVDARAAQPAAAPRS
jgi:hypothetical protein